MDKSIDKGGRHKIKDLINSKDANVELIGWRSNDTVIVEDWKFIDFKRPPSEVYSYKIEKRVHLNAITFEHCTFKDVNFIGGVPIDCCTFKNCTFENCILTDTIRWTVFNKSTFTNCIFGGYFHGTKFTPNCKFIKVFVFEDGYNNIPYSLKKRCPCSEIEKIELLKYFYPIESKVFEDYIVKSPYLISIPAFDFIDIRKDIKKIYKVNDKEYFKDTVKEISFDLMQYEPEIRICGRFAPTVDDCIPYLKTMN